MKQKSAASSGEGQLCLAGGEIIPAYVRIDSKSICRLESIWPYVPTRQRSPLTLALCHGARSKDLSGWVCLLWLPSTVEAVEGKPQW